MIVGAFFLALFELRVYILSFYQLKDSNCENIFFWKQNVLVSVVVMILHQVFYFLLYFGVLFRMGGSISAYSLRGQCYVILQHILKFKKSVSHTLPVIAFRIILLMVRLQFSSLSRMREQPFHF